MEAFVRFALRRASLVCALASSALASSALASGAHATSALATSGLATSALATSALATGWLVDDDGGVGVDFTDIQAAIDAARDGDVIRVRPGEYGGFKIEGKGVRVLGGPGVRCHDGIAIFATPPAALVVVSGVVLTGVRDPFFVGSTSGPVLVQDVVGGLQCSGCADVRAFAVVGAIRSVDSRLELVRSLCQGVDGVSGKHPTGGDAGIDVWGGRAHVALTSATGGRGGDLHGDGFASGGPGYGGAGLRVIWNGWACVAGGPTDAFVGGVSGEDLSWHPWFCLEGGPGLHLSELDPSAELHWSGVSPFGGPGATGCPLGPPLLGPVTHVVPDDPTLELVGRASAGARVRFRVRGPVGARVELVLGRTPIVVADGRAAIERLATRDVVLALGTLPASGELVCDVPTEPAPAGTVFVGQAELEMSVTHELRRTNSAPVVVH
ncbi:MAG: hypothetical protein L6Q99_18495 [Planctomycetes bacterium]|nr:hypothetical protein [Planctomycetota bacterium]